MQTKSENFQLLLSFAIFFATTLAAEIQVTPKPSMPAKVPQKAIIVAPIMVKPPELQPRSMVYRHGALPAPFSFPGTLPAPPALIPPSQFHRALMTSMSSGPFPPMAFQPPNMLPHTVGIPLATPNIPQPQNGISNRMLGQDVVSMSPFHGANGAALAASVSSPNANSMTPVPISKHIEMSNLRASDKLARYESMTHKLEDLAQTIELVNKNIDEVDSRLKDNFRNLDIDIQKIEVLKKEGRYQGYL